MDQQKFLNVLMLVMLLAVEMKMMMMMINVLAMNDLELMLDLSMMEV
jgi:hypothetical protein